MKGSVSVIHSSTLYLSLSCGQFPLPETSPNDTSGLRPEWDSGEPVPDMGRVGYECPGHKKALGNQEWIAVR